MHEKVALKPLLCINLDTSPIGLGTTSYANYSELWPSTDLAGFLHQKMSWTGPQTQSRLTRKSLYNRASCEPATA